MARRTIETEQAPAAIGPYVQGVLAEGWLFTSMQIPLDPGTGELVGEAEPEQARRCLQSIQAIVIAAGGSLEDVVKTTVYLTDIAAFGAVNEIYAEFFGGELPARGVLEAAALPSLNLLQGQDAADEYMLGVVDRHLDLAIEARVRGAGAIDATLNQIAKEVTLALRGNPDLGLPGAVIFVEEGPTDEPVVSGEASQPVALMAMAWTVHYRTSVPDPSVI